MDTFALQCLAHVYKVLHLMVGIWFFVFAVRFVVTALQSAAVVYVHWF
jgi:hypothetical protein